MIFDQVRLRRSFPISMIGHHPSSGGSLFLSYILTCLFYSILVEPERRQWGWLNFVAFWIADSLNVVSLGY